MCGKQDCSAQTTPTQCQLYLDMLFIQDDELTPFPTQETCETNQSSSPLHQVPPLLVII